MRVFSSIVAVLAGACMLAGSAVAQDSGFLGDAYAKLQDVQSPSGQKVKRWVSPALTPAKYPLLLLDKTVFHPPPEPTDQVSATTLNEISAYLDEALRRELAGVVQLATGPGPTTLRLRPAITAAAAKALGLKPYQYIPIAFIFTKATGSEAKGASLAVEYEVQDAATSEVLAAGMRSGTGPQLASPTAKLTLADFKPIIDVWAKDAGAFVESLKLGK